MKNVQFELLIAWRVALRRSWLAWLLGARGWSDERRNHGVLRREFLPLVPALLIGALPPILFDQFCRLVVPSWAIRGDTAFVGDYPLAAVVSGITVAMLVAATFALRFFHERRAELSGLIDDPGRGIRTFIRRHEHPLVQLAFAVIPIALGLAGIAIWNAAHHYDMSVAGYVWPLWAVGLGGLCLHWSMVLPLVLDRLLRPEVTADVAEFDPASTGWIKLLARFAAFAGCLVLLVAVLLLVVLATIDLRQEQEPGSLGSLAQVAVLVVASALLLSIGWIAGIPAWQLTTVITTAKRQELSRIDGEIRAAQGRRGLFRQRVYSERTIDLISLYRTISGAPDTPFPSGTVVQYIAVAIGVILTLVVSWLVQVLPRT